MTDIVQRLRAMNPPHGNATANEAADTIERLSRDVESWKAAYNASRANEERLRAILEKRDGPLKDSATVQPKECDHFYLGPEGGPEESFCVKCGATADKSKL